MTIKMSVDVRADGLGQAMRVMEAIIATLYKSNVIYFQYRGMRVPAEALIADNVELEKKTEFTYDDSQIAHAKFDLDLNTTFPVFDQPSVMSKARMIRDFRATLNSRADNEVYYDFTVDEDTYIQGLIREIYS